MAIDFVGISVVRRGAGRGLFAHRLALAGTVVMMAAGGFVAWRSVARAPRGVGPGMVYVASGLGGYRTGQLAVRANVAGPKAVPAIGGGVTAKVDPVGPALLAYGKGDFAGTRRAAEAVVARATPSSPIDARRAAVRALDLMAFSKARQGDLAGAREDFARLRRDAAALPDHGKPEGAVALGDSPEPTFEENAAYQHAVCTAALGDKAGAEAEYVAFMRQYPESPLLQASIKRIARLHGGDIPKQDEAVWRVAMNTARSHELARERDASLCGPECLAELARRGGHAAPATSVGRLALEMQTNQRGTSLAALESAARRHGFARAQGVSMTAKGLAGQRLPVIALVLPGHYVLVDAVTASGGVRVWDPDGDGIGHPANREIAAKPWSGIWRGGVALALR